MTAKHTFKNKRKNPLNIFGVHFEQEQLALLASLNLIVSVIVGKYWPDVIWVDNLPLVVKSLHSAEDFQHDIIWFALRPNAQMPFRPINKQLNITSWWSNNKEHIWYVKTSCVVRVVTYFYACLLVTLLIETNSGYWFLWVMLLRLQLQHKSKTGAVQKPAGLYILWSASDHGT